MGSTEVVSRIERQKGSMYAADSNDLWVAGKYFQQMVMYTFSPHHAGADHITAAHTIA